jgi:DNA helicase-2/ATP-dependent DNA helicase PcrA
MVVGDEDQAIYNFRGSNVGHILSFTERYPGARVIELGANYRCSPQILAAADRLVRHNVQRRAKRLWSEASSSDPVLHLRFQDPRHEARYLTQMISESLKEGRDPEEHAILCRTRRQMLPLQHHLGMAGINYRTVGAIELWQRSDVKLVLAWLKTILNPLDLGAGAHCMTHWPKLGAATISRWKELNLQRDGVPVFSCLRLLLHEPRCGPHTKKGQQIERMHEVSVELLDRARTHTVRDLVRWLYGVVGLDDEISEARNSTGALAEEGARRLALKQDLLSLCPSDPGTNTHTELQTFLDALLLNARREAEEPAVIVSTIHGAKGLEWDSVWVPGLVEGLLPYGGLDQDGRPTEISPDRAEEERRLAYVAFTRARRRLILSSYRQMEHGERRIFVPPSRFLSECQPPKKPTPVDPGHVGV